MVFDKLDSSSSDIWHILACIPVFLQQNISKRTVRARLRYTVGAENGETERIKDIKPGGQNNESGDTNRRMERH